MKQLKVVLIGGGTGLSVLARREYPIDITAIVTVVMMVVVLVKYEVRWIYLLQVILEMLSQRLSDA